MPVTNARGLGSDSGGVFCPAARWGSCVRSPACWQGRGSPSVLWAPTVALQLGSRPPREVSLRGPAADPSPPPPALRSVGCFHCSPGKRDRAQPPGSPCTLHTPTEHPSLLRLRCETAKEILGCGGTCTARSLWGGAFAQVHSGLPRTRWPSEVTGTQLLGPTHTREWAEAATGRREWGHRGEEFGGAWVRGLGGPLESQAS